ncbi:MAG: caspase family protein [Henriciella sp.]
MEPEEVAIIEEAPSVEDQAEAEKLESDRVRAEQREAEAQARAQEQMMAEGDGLLAILGAAGSSDDDESEDAWGAFDDEDEDGEQGRGRQPIGLGTSGSGVGGGGSATGGLGIGNIGSIGGLGSGGSGAGAGEPEDDFDTGRIIHHAPKSMVQDRTYYLEVAIQPVTSTDTVEEVDLNLTATLGSGNMPGVDAAALERSLDTLDVSDLMSAKLVGRGFDMFAITDEVQPVDAGDATVWQWEVTPQETGTFTLVFVISKSIERDGRQVNKSVKRIPLRIRVESLDDLLAPEPDLVMSRNLDARAGITTDAGQSSALDASAATTLAMPANAACETLPGSDANRFALLMTNLGYQAPLSRLSETHLDGERMAAALQQVGFTVTHCRDLGRQRAIRELSLHGLRLQDSLAADQDPVSFFYYSGHGLNMDGTNYILPTDLAGASEIDVRDGAVAFEDIFNRLPQGPLSFVVFDACRTVMADDSKGLMRTYEPVTWVSGLFQAFATEPGKTAADDGLYSKILSELMISLNEPANVLFKRVQDQVGRVTAGRQNPNYIDRTIGDEFFFVSEG